MEQKKARDATSNTALTTKPLRTSTEKTLPQRLPKPPIKKRLFPVVVSDPIAVENQSKAQAAILLKEYERSWRVSLLLFNMPLASR
jgi:hypothetical protein